MNFSIFKAVGGNLERPRAYHTVKSEVDTFPFWKSFKGCYLIKSTGIEDIIYLLRDVRFNGRRLASRKQFTVAKRELGLRSGIDYFCGSHQETITRLKAIYRPELRAYHRLKLIGEAREVIEIDGSEDDSTEGAAKTDSSVASAVEEEEQDSSSSDSAAAEDNSYSGQEENTPPPSLLNKRRLSEIVFTGEGPKPPRLKPIRKRSKLAFK